MDRNDQSSPKRDSTGVWTLRSFTIKQINGCAPDEESLVHRVDSVEVTNFRLVGWVSMARTSAKGSVFVLEDGTGRIDCTFWPNSSYEEEQGKLLEEKALLRVNGSLKMFNGKKSVSASHLARVDDPNFVFYHFLSCIFQHLLYTKQLRDKRGKDDGGAKLPKIQEDILECYRKNQDENGLHVNIVLRMLSKKYSESSIRENIDMLLHDCHLYSVDGLEYRTTM